MKRFSSKFNAIISIILVLAMLFLFSSTLIACTMEDSGTDDELPPDNGGIDVGGTEIKETFVSIQFNELVVNSTNVGEIKVEDIKVNPTIVKEIESIDIEVVTINDEFVYIAYQNFVDYYGADIDWEQFIKDIVIGSACVLVMVTLSTVAGPVGTFFGAVICSEFSVAAVAIGIAIDAAVAGYQAYQEGGDISYILGHMLNGIADGCKWSALLAPLTGIVDGVKALRAVSKLTKVPGFDDLTQKQATALFKNLSNVLDSTKRLTKEATDSALKEAYQAASKNLSSEITEELFIKAFRQQSTLISLVKATDPFNTASDLVKTLKKNFMSNAGASDNVAESIIKQLKNGTIKKLDDISQPAVREYIDQNLKEFVEYFGNSITKDLIDDLLERKLGKSSVEAIASFIAKSKNAYSEIVEQIGKESIDSVLSNVDSLVLLQVRYGSKNVLNLVHTKTLYDVLLQRNADIPTATVKKVIDGFIDGTVKSVDDISKISSKVAQNATKSREIVIQSLKDLGLGKKMSSFIDELVVDKMTQIGSKSLSKEEFEGFKEMTENIVKNKLTKDQIIQNYGEKCYEELWKPNVEVTINDTNFIVNNANITIGALGVQNSLNKELVDAVFKDSLMAKGVNEEAVSKILQGAPVSGWGLADDEILDIGNTVALYYQSLDKTTYDNFLGEFVEVRCKTAKDWNVAQGYIPVNGEYASKICPTDNVYIKEKYGDIFYNSAGYPIFDKYAIARVEVTNLTGDSAKDIAKANMLHHGTTANIPGYTWHHLEDGKTLILIPTELHQGAVSGYSHSGGAKLLRDGAFGVRG